MTNKKFIVRIKKEYRNRVSTDLMHAVDWYPTILSLSAPKARKSDKSAQKRPSASRRDNALMTHGDGYSMWDVISENKKGPRTELVYNINDALRYKIH